MSKPLEKILITISSPLPDAVMGKDAQWVELSLEGRHENFANAVWKMAGDTRSPDCEEEVTRLISTWNACLGVSADKLGIGVLNNAILQGERLRQERDQLIEVIQFLLLHPDKITPKMAARAVLSYHGAEVPR